MEGVIVLGDGRRKRGMSWGSGPYLSCVRIVGTVEKKVVL